MLEVLSCEIEETLLPDIRRQAINNYVFQILRSQISLKNYLDEIERDTQLYIAVERAFAHSDNPLIRYRLLKLMIPEITTITWKSAESILPKIYDIYREIEKALDHPLADKMRSAVKKQSAPYLILRDLFEQNEHSINDILSES